MAAVVSVFSAIFCAVPAASRVEPASTSGPVTSSTAVPASGRGRAARGVDDGHRRRPALAGRPQRAQHVGRAAGRGDPDHHVARSDAQPRRRPPARPRRRPRRSRPPRPPPRRRPRAGRARGPGRSRRSGGARRRPASRAARRCPPRRRPAGRRSGTPPRRRRRRSRAAPAAAATATGAAACPSSSRATRSGVASTSRSSEPVRTPSVGSPSTSPASPGGATGARRRTTARSCGVVASSSRPDEARGGVAVRVPPHQLGSGGGEAGGEGVREPADDGALRPRRGPSGGVDGRGERGDGVVDDPPRHPVPALRRGEHGRRELRERAGGVRVRGEQVPRRPRERGRRARPVEGPQRGSQPVLAEPRAAARVPEQQAVPVDASLPPVASDPSATAPVPTTRTTWLAARALANAPACQPTTSEVTATSTGSGPAQPDASRSASSPAARRWVSAPGTPTTRDHDSPRGVTDRDAQRGGHRRGAPGAAEPGARRRRGTDVGRARDAPQRPRARAPQVDGDDGHGPTSGMPPGGVRSPGGMMSISIRYRSPRATDSTRSTTSPCWSREVRTKRSAGAPGSTPSKAASSGPSTTGATDCVPDRNPAPEPDRQDVVVGRGALEVLPAQARHPDGRDVQRLQRHRLAVREPDAAHPEHGLAAGHLQPRGEVGVGHDDVRPQQAGRRRQPPASHVVAERGRHQRLRDGRATDERPGPVPALDDPPRHELLEGLAHRGAGHPEPDRQLALTWQHGAGSEIGAEGGDLGAHLGRSGGTHGERYRPLTSTTSRGTYQCASNVSWCRRSTPTRGGRGPGRSRCRRPRPARSSCARGTAWSGIGSGLDVEALRGTDVLLDSGDGPVLLGGRRPAAPCAWMDVVLAPGAHAALRGRARGAVRGARQWDVAGRAVGGHLPAGGLAARRRRRRGPARHPPRPRPRRRRDPSPADDGPTAPALGS